MGCWVARKCFVACLFFEESQQPTWPQVKHRRRCTQLSPILRHSSQPSLFGLILRIWSTCVQVSAIEVSFALHRVNHIVACIGIRTWKRVSPGTDLTVTRSEEHTSELQSRLHLVCRLLLEKKKNI